MYSIFVVWIMGLVLDQTIYSSIELSCTVSLHITLVFSKKSSYNPTHLGSSYEAFHLGYVVSLKLLSNACACKSPVGSSIAINTLTLF